MPITKKEISPVIRGAVQRLLARSTTHEDTALIAGALVAVAVSLYETAGGAKFAADILRQIADDLTIPRDKLN